MTTPHTLTRRALTTALTAANAPAAEWLHFGPGPEECWLCGQPTNPELPAYDCPMCDKCYNEFGAFDPVLDGAALEIAEEILK